MIKEACRNYFHLIRHPLEEGRKPHDKILTAIAILSCFSLVIPVAMGAFYGIAKLKSEDPEIEGVARKVGIVAEAQVKRSWRRVNILYEQLENEEKTDFLYAFLTNKEVDPDSLFADLHRMAESYRESGLEVDLVSRLIRLDAFAFEEVKYWNEAHETLYALAEKYVQENNSHITVLYPLLTGSDQIRILQQLQDRAKVLLKLFPLSATAALEHPGQLLQCLIPRELSIGRYGVALQGLPELSQTALHLQQKLPKAYPAMEALLMTMPEASILGIFWKIAKSEKPGVWEKNRKVTVENLSEEERRAIKALSFEEVLVLHKFEQPWTEMWYKVGQTPERLRQACFSLSHDDENRYRQEKNREKFLNFLSHEDIRALIIEDPDCVELAKIFGNSWEVDERDITGPEERLYTFGQTERIMIPFVLMRWWGLYDQVDYLERFNVLSTFYTNEDLLKHFEARHNNHIRLKPFVDAYVKEFNEKMEYVRAEINRGNYNPRYEDFMRAKDEARRAKVERERAERTLLAEFKTAIEGLGLDPKNAYTEQEILRSFRLWSVKNHPDKHNNTREATERFQKMVAHRDILIKLLLDNGYSKTPICWI